MTKPKPANPTLALVVWKDAISDEASESGVAIASLATLTEVGFLLDQNDEAILLGMELDGPDCLPGRWRLHIPKNAIISLKTINLSKAFRERPLKRATLPSPKITTPSP